MSQHPKYHALADRLMKRRLEHLNEVQTRRGEDDANPAKNRVSLHGKQIPLAFAQEPMALEIFHQFDTQHREVEWSYYTETGEFLLQFGFSLEDHSYQVYMTHPALFHDREDMDTYLTAIQESLSQHYPPLALARDDSGRVEIQRTM